jgi:hypothetical protein
LRAGTTFTLRQQRILPTLGDEMPAQPDDEGGKTKPGAIEEELVQEAQQRQPEQRERSPSPSGRECAQAFTLGRRLVLAIRRKLAHELRCRSHDVILQG